VIGSLCHHRGEARQSTGQPRGSQRGFTLLELLVVMSLLSIIMIGLVSALRTMAQTESKIDARLERLDEIRVARTFLQQTLTRVSTMALDAPGATGKTMIPFVATPDSLTWVGILPARPNVGGRHFFRLAIEDTSVGRELVLRFSPWAPDIIFSEWSSAQSRVLLRGIGQMKIQAQGLLPDRYSTAQAWPKGWQDGWPIADSLPEQVRLGLVDTQGEWPEWTIALHALPQGDNTFSRVAAGGGSIR
jgi:general secretion pathway protein J